jgi:hypothetical protein
MMTALLEQELQPHESAHTLAERLLEDDAIGGLRHARSKWKRGRILRDAAACANRGLSAGGECQKAMVLCQYRGREIAWWFGVFNDGVRTGQTLRPAGLSGQHLLGQNGADAIAAHETRQLVLLWGVNDQHLLTESMHAAFQQDGCR